MRFMLIYMCVMEPNRCDTFWILSARDWTVAMEPNRSPYPQLDTFCDGSHKTIHNINRINDGLLKHRRKVSPHRSRMLNND